MKTHTIYILYQAAPHWLGLLRPAGKKCVVCDGVLCASQWCPYWPSLVSTSAASGRRSVEEASRTKSLQACTPESEVNIEKKLPSWHEGKRIWPDGWRRRSNACWMYSDKTTVKRVGGRQEGWKGKKKGKRDTEGEIIRSRNLGLDWYPRAI